MKEEAMDVLEWDVIAEKAAPYICSIQLVVDKVVLFHNREGDQKLSALAALVLFCWS